MLLLWQCYCRDCYNGSYGSCYGYYKCGNWCYDNMLRMFYGNGNHGNSSHDKYLICFDNVDKKLKG